MHACRNGRVRSVEELSQKISPRRPLLAPLKEHDAVLTIHGKIDRENVLAPGIRAFS
jgi:hypothetical protein